MTEVAALNHRITLLITTYNRGDLLHHNLSRLCELTLPDELIVIDDGGTDNTEAVCNEFKDRLPLRYFYHDHPGASICSQARNIGVKLATSDLIVTCEPEMVFLTDVLAQLQTQHDISPHRVISAGTIYHGEHGQMWHAAPNHNAPTLGWVAPYIALYKREWLIAVGGWDESFPGNWGWDDTDLLTRLRIAGCNQTIDQHIKAVHQWHPLGGDVGSVNNEHFLAKSFHGDGDIDKTDVVANRGKPWGVLRTKNS